MTLILGKERIKQLHEQGYSAYQIAKILHCSETPIKRRLGIMGLETTGFGLSSEYMHSPRLRPEPVEKTWLPEAIRLYALGWPHAMIAEHLGKGTHGVREALIDAGVKSRTMNEALRVMPPERRQQQVKKMFEASRAKPNGMEKELRTILNARFPGEWSYVGDGKLLVGTLNPDFVHTSRPLVIEYFGTYWHDKAHTNRPLYQEESRRGYFKERGYEMLVLQEWDLDHPLTLVHKVDQFMYADTWDWIFN